MQGRNMTRWRDPKTDPRQEKKSNVITPQGHAKMKGLADHLRRVRRPELSRKTGEAAAMGDRSENADCQKEPQMTYYKLQAFVF
ncbi:hypothetical protein FLM52_05635 [bacterium Scap17]|nr:hypothetical protein [bacterium Scap17]